MAEGNALTIRGTFEDQDGGPIAGAAVHELFLGDPPTNCGTKFDLEVAPAHTDTSGEFRIDLSDLDSYLHRWPVEAGRSGCFLIVAVKDAWTIGCAIASGQELTEAPIHLQAMPLVEMRGKVSDGRGGNIAEATIQVERYDLCV